MRVLPNFPWDSLADQAAIARSHPDGIIDLSVGDPVDPVPLIIQEALNAAAYKPGYPTTHGSGELRATAAAALARRFAIISVNPDSVLPTIGSKELIAWLPSLLGFGAIDSIVIPELAYPTYEVGARLAGARTVRANGLTALGPQRIALIWLNSPSNPTGQVLSIAHLRKIVSWARERDVIVASDECYLGLGWEAEPISILHPAVCGDSHDGLLAVHSLSKSSNLAGYRAGFVTGDPKIIAGLLEIRKHAGMMVPYPVQAAMIAALSDDEHVAIQRDRYAQRRSVLLPALKQAGFTIDHSEAGLYLWASRDENAWDTVDWLAKRGILVAPGTFYGPAGARHVRIALTASDARITAAAHRLG